MINIAEMIASIVESAIVVRLCNRFLGFRDKRLMILKSAVFFLLLSAENILSTQWEWRGTKSIMLESFFVVLLIILIGIYVFLFLDGRIYEKILITFFPAISILPINMIILNVIRMLSGGDMMDVIEPSGNARIPALIFSKLAFFLLCEFVIHMKKRMPYSLSGFQWGMQMSSFAVTFLLTYFIFQIAMDKEEMTMVFLVSVMIALLNVLLYIMLYKMQHDNAIREEYRIAQINLAAQERFVDEARERYMEMRTLRHDMRHYLMTAAELISGNRTGEAKEYIEKVVDEKVDRISPGINTGNVVIDAVINNRISACMRRGIEMKCMIDSCFRDVDDMDISILLSNVLDNAISGCADVKSPEIELVVGTRKTFTYIIVKNSIASSVLSKNPDLETNKGNRTLHGFGIMSIRKIADKYNGSVEFKEEQGFFITEIWLEGASQV